MPWLVLFIVFWTVCGVLSYGLGFAYWQREWPSLAERDYGRDKRDSVLLAFFGPITLVAYLANTGRDFKKHGLKWK